MKNSRDVWVFIEQQVGGIAAVSLELLSKAQDLAAKLNSRVCALLLGHEIAHLTEQLIHHGAERRGGR